MSFQDLEAGNGVRGAPRKNGRAAAGGPGAGASQAVAAGVFQINTAVATFQRLVNTLGTPKDTPDLRERMYVTALSP
jgi:syntaxin 7